MPTVAGERSTLATPTLAHANQAVQQMRRIWQRSLPIWAQDCMILQARGLRDPKWTPFISPELWNVDDDDAAVRAAA